MLRNQELRQHVPRSNAAGAFRPAMRCGRVIVHGQSQGHSMRPPCSSAQSVTLARRRQSSRHLDPGARGAPASGWRSASSGLLLFGVLSAVPEAVGATGVACGEGVGAAGAIDAIGDVEDACGEDAGCSTRVGADGGEQATAVTENRHGRSAGLISAPPGRGRVERPTALRVVIR